MTCTVCKTYESIENQHAVSVQLTPALVLGWHTLGACCERCGDALWALGRELEPVLLTFLEALGDGTANMRPVLVDTLLRDDMRSLLARVLQERADAVKGCTMPEQEAVAILRGAAQIVEGGTS